MLSEIVVIILLAVAERPTSVRILPTCLDVTDFLFSLYQPPEFCYDITSESEESQVRNSFKGRELQGVHLLIIPIHFNDNLEACAFGIKIDHYFHNWTPILIQ